MSAGWLKINKQAEGGPRVFRKVGQYHVVLSGSDARMLRLVPRPLLSLLFTLCSQDYTVVEHSLVPRPSPSQAFGRLAVRSVFAYCKQSKAGGKEGLRMKLEERVMSKFAIKGLVVPLIIF